MSKNIKKQSLEELQKRRAEIYEKFMPTLRSYNQLASEALALQIEIYRRNLAHAFPEAAQEETPRVVTFPAKESPDAFKNVLDSLAEVAVERVIFDPVRAEFHVFAKPTKNER